MLEANKTALLQYHLTRHFYSFVICSLFFKINFPKKYFSKTRVLNRLDLDQDRRLVGPVLDPIKLFAKIAAHSKIMGIIMITMTGLI